MTERCKGAKKAPDLKGLPNATPGDQQSLPCSSGADL